MPDYWGDSNTAANSTAPEPPPAADPDQGLQAGKTTRQMRKLQDYRRALRMDWPKARRQVSWLASLLVCWLQLAEPLRCFSRRSSRYDSRSSRRDYRQQRYARQDSLAQRARQDSSRACRRCNRRRISVEDFTQPAMPLERLRPQPRKHQLHQLLLQLSQPAYGNVTGKRVVDNLTVQRAWDSVHDPNAIGTPRILYRNHWRRFWRAVRCPENANAHQYFTDNGFRFPTGKATAPFHPRVGNNRFGRPIRIISCG
jgi:hypothetical protein